MWNWIRSSWAWVREKPERQAAALISCVVSLPFLLNATYYVFRESPPCQQETRHEAEARDTLSFREYQKGAYELQYQAGATDQPHSCTNGHTAEEWIALLTAYLVGFTSALATFTALLWWETRQGAEKTLTANEGSHRRELRAYVNIKSYKITFAGDSSIKKARAFVAFANFGKTPAHNLRVTGTLRMMTWPIGELPPFQEPKDPFASRAVLGPTAEREWESNDVTDVHLANVSGTLNKPSRDVLVAWGRISYIDVFGAEQFTEFKAIVGGPCGPGVETALEDGRHAYRMRTGWDHNNAS